MSPDEVIKKVSLLGVDISRATLLRYENQELIPKPKRGGGGAGGRWTDYPETTVEEVVAAWSLLHGEYGSERFLEFFYPKPPKISPQTVKKIRQYGQYIQKRTDYINELFHEKIKDYPGAYIKYTGDGIKQCGDTPNAYIIASVDLAKIKKENRRRIDQEVDEISNEYDAQNFDETIIKKDELGCDFGMLLKPYSNIWNMLVVNIRLELYKKLEEK